MLVTAVLIRPLSPSRAVAFQTLKAIDDGAYASDTLFELSGDLQSRDAGLAAQIVFGCLRYQAQLDYLIGMYSGRNPAELDPAVLHALRAAIFQLRYLERVPSHAAVHESVEYVKAEKRAASGMVNAVLRKVNRSPVSWPDNPTRLSCPAWLLGRWRRQFGEQQSVAIAEAALTEPPAYIRVPAGTQLPLVLPAEPTGVPGCFRLLAPAPAGVRLHDISSQAIVPLLELQAGQSYLDLCAAPGNKTFQALETPLGLAIACDVSLKRLRSVPPICPRVVLDGTGPLPFSRQFDRIFIDAPCSGTGTLSRNPEIKWRVQAEDLGAFAHRQAQLLRQALRLLAPGGKLVYATCSLEAEENERVVSAVLAAVPSRKLVDEMWRLPGRDEGDGFYAAVLQ